MVSLNSILKPHNNLFEVSYLLKIVLLCIVYFATAYLGLKIAPVSGFATLVWAPTGLSLVTLFLLGFELWPGIFLGAFLVNLISGATLPISIAIGIGNTLEAVLGAYFLKKAGFKIDFSAVEDTIKFLFLATLISTLVSPIIGVLSLWLGHFVNSANLLSTFSAWWVGDILGDLIIASFIFLWWSGWESLQIKTALWEFLTWIVCIFLVGVLIFSHLLKIEFKNPSMIYLIFPPLIWGSIRFKQPYVITAVSFLSLFSIWGTVHGFGSFTAGGLSNNLLQLQIFIGVVVVTMLLLTAAVTQSENMQERAMKLNTSLNKEIEEVDRLNKILTNLIKEKPKKKAKPDNSLPR